MVKLEQEAIDLETENFQNEKKSATTQSIDDSLFQAIPEIYLLDSQDLLAKTEKVDLEIETIQSIFFNFNFNFNINNIYIIYIFNFIKEEISTNETNKRINLDQELKEVSSFHSSI